ncbi:MAG: GAF domain-containing SpoIIE family protein phosphatase [Leptolyngbyaceae bacterium]|nr:GAF domain-containing SpoIIE family protein phosphatase [Leptolyngbyaceae bacterium]
MSATPVSQPSFDAHPQSGSPLEPAQNYASTDLVTKLYREQNKIHDLLSSLSFALRSLRNLNQFLELTPLIASRVTDADGGALVLFKADGQMQLERLHCQAGNQCQSIRSAMDLATRQVMEMVRETPVEPRLLTSQLLSTLDQQVHAILGSDVHLFGTPILVRNTERGRLYIFSYSDDFAWTDARQKLVRLVSDQTSVAIENDELNAELRKKERLDRELEIGAEIQSQLLPRHCPTIEGATLAARCKNANRVGGDYYDFVPADYDQLQYRPCNRPEQGRWSITIGDVMGKGVPAGLIMTMLRGMLRAEILNQHTPARILQHLNHVMYGDLDNSNRFVTLFYSEYDPKTRLLSFSNAAHNPPLLWRAESQTLEKLDSDGMLIGLEMNTQYEDGQVQLFPGDTVVYYTDGFTEAANPEGTRFEEENLLSAIERACRQGYAPQRILDYLFEQIQQFIGVARHNEDDMTLVVLQVNADTEAKSSINP